ncbi:hypothetical protein [Chitinimonas sp.]
MSDPERYQQADTDDYPRLGRLLIVLLLVAVAIGIATFAAVSLLGEA